MNGAICRSDGHGAGISEARRLRRLQRLAVSIGEIMKDQRLEVDACLVEGLFAE